MKDIGRVLSAATMSDLFAASRFFHKTISIAECVCVVDRKKYSNICFGQLNKDFKKIRYLFKMRANLGAALEYLELQSGFLFDDVVEIKKQDDTYYYYDLDNSGIVYPQLCALRVLQEEPSLVPVYNCLRKSFGFNPVSAWMVLHKLKWNWCGHSFADAGGAGNSAGFINNITMFLFEYKTNNSLPNTFVYTSNYFPKKTFEFNSPEDLLKFKDVRTIGEFNSVCKK